MGIFRQQRFTAPRRSHLGHKTKVFRDHHRSEGERRALIWSCLAAIICVAAAIAWPNWATAHSAVIFCGLSVMLIFAPWIEDREAAPELNFEQRERQAAMSQPGQDVEQRRAA